MTNIEATIPCSAFTNRQGDAVGCTTKHDSYPVVMWKCLTWDATVADTFAASNLELKSAGPSEAANGTTLAKKMKIT